MMYETKFCKDWSSNLFGKGTATQHSRHGDSIDTQTAQTHRQHGHTYSTDTRTARTHRAQPHRQHRHTDSTDTQTAQTHRQHGHKDSTDTHSTATQTAQTHRQHRGRINPLHFTEVTKEGHMQSGDAADSLSGTALHPYSGGARLGCVPGHGLSC
jgi:hypothetical protein